MSPAVSSVAELLADALHCVTLHTASRIAWLDDLRCARAVTAELIRCDEELLIRSLAWAVTPRQVIWLLRRREATLNHCMALFKDRSARAVQCAAGRSGRIWQAGYHDHVVAVEDIESIARNVIRTPIHEGIAERLEQYPHWHCDSALAASLRATEMGEAATRLFPTAECDEY